MYSNVNKPKSLSTILFLLLLSCNLCFVESMCDLTATLEQYLLNEGFHRNITYKLTFKPEVEEILHDDCSIGMHQILPAGVYANPDELADLMRLKKINVRPKDTVNIELPADQADPMSVFIISKIYGNIAQTWLPVHARYHPATANGGYVRNSIPAPRVYYVRCGDARLARCGADLTTLPVPCEDGHTDMCTWRKITANVVTEPLVLDVPVGNQSDFHLVSLGTAAAAVAASLYLLKTLHEYKLTTLKKRT